MNVAIIGAGVAGLACAHELEKYGISPTVYEKNSYIGEQMPHVGALLEVAQRPVKDPLDIKPLNTINKIVNRSPNKTTVIEGNLGYFIKRGKDLEDLKNQLYMQLKNTKLLLSEMGDYETLSKEYYYVVIADGMSTAPQELGCFNATFKAYERDALILGDFDPNTLFIWLNKDYCKNGYAYLIPFDTKKAFVTLIVSDVNESEIEYFWELFKSTENIKYPIVEEFKLEHIAGHVYPYTTGNILFAGNACGALDPFLCFGQLNAIVTGAMAARSIALNADYEYLIKDFTLKNKEMYQFRLALNKATNSTYNKIIRAIGIPGIKHLIYYSPLDIIKICAKIIKFISKSK